MCPLCPGGETNTDSEEMPRLSGCCCRWTLCLCCSSSSTFSAAAHFSAPAAACDASLLWVLPQMDFLHAIGSFLLGPDVTLLNVRILSSEYIFHANTVVQVHTPYLDPWTLPCCGRGSTALLLSASASMPCVHSTLLNTHCPSHVLPWALQPVCQACKVPCRALLRT